MFSPSPPPQALTGFIKEYSRFLVAGHTEPDGDCVASQLVLCNVLQRLGKTAIPCSAGPFKRGESAQFENQFIKEISDELKADFDSKRTAVIIVDCSAAGRTGDIEQQFAGLPVAVIDHHATGTLIDAKVHYIDPDAPATVLLVFLLIKALGEKITRDDARLLFLGLCTDTGFFRHLGAGSAEVFKIAAELAEAGANPKETFNLMSGGKSFNSRLLLGAIISRAESLFNGKLILSSEKFEETERYGLESRDSDSLYQLLLAVDGVEAVVIIRQESAENCTVGLRSRDVVDVAKIAAALGGGGHKNAAGLKTKAKILEIREKILLEFKKIL